MAKQKDLEVTPLVVWRECDLCGPRGTEETWPVPRGSQRSRVPCSSDIENPDAYSDVVPAQVALRDVFAEELRQLLGTQFTDKQLRGFPTIKAQQWIEKAPELISMIKRIITPTTGA